MPTRSGWKHAHQDVGRPPGWSAGPGC
jgi:hypothetical protein